MLEGEKMWVQVVKGGNNLPPPLGGKGLTDQPKIVCVCGWVGALALGFGLMSARSFKNYEQGLIKI